MHHYLSERIIVCDIESTGLVPGEGADRLIEVAAIEIISKRKTGRVFHEYVDPGIEVPEEAYKIHGLSREDLIAAGNGQVFSQVAEALLQFIGTDTFVAHNAPFDVSFLDFELERAGYPRVSSLCRVFDTLAFANVKHPGQRNNLNALCKRYGIDISARIFHGALLDADLLADLFVSMVATQGSLDFKFERANATVLTERRISTDLSSQLLVAQLTEDELKQHMQVMTKLVSNPNMAGWQ